MTRLSQRLREDDRLRADLRAARMAQGAAKVDAQRLHADLRKAEAELDRLRPAVIDRIREVARSLGWAIGVHGSLRRDIDLIGVPWTKDAVPWRVLYAALLERVPLWDGEGTALGQHLGPFGRVKALALQPGCEKASDHPKGHWSPPCIDLSLVDPRPDAQP